MDMDNHLQDTGVYLDHNHHHLYNADGEKGHIEKLHFQFYNFSKDRTLLNFHRPFLFGFSLGWGQSEWGCWNILLCYTIHVRYCPVPKHCSVLWADVCSRRGRAQAWPRPALYKYAQTGELGECFLRPPAATIIIISSTVTMIKAVLLLCTLALLVLATQAAVVR